MKNETQDLCPLTIAPCPLLYWALADNQGSIRYVLDNQGNVINEITYNAFGRVTSESNPAVDFRFGYTGREFDEETGLYYYRSRYYDATVGRFVSEDAIGFAGGDSNLYRYTFNSPLNYTDPSGEIVPALAVPLVYKAIVDLGALAVAGLALYNLQQLKEDVDQKTTSLPPDYFPNPGGFALDPEINKFNRTETIPQGNDEPQIYTFPNDPDIDLPRHTGGDPCDNPFGDLLDNLLPFPPFFESSSSYIQLHEGNQNKHIPGTHEYKTEISQGRVNKSILSHPDPEALIQKFTGTGQPKSPGKSYGDSGYRELIDFGQNIGVYKNKSGSVQLPTTKGIIHYGKRGAHIIPAQP